MDQLNPLFSLDELLEFIAEAKLHTYAAVKEIREKYKVEHSGKISFIYTKGEFTYCDTYEGSLEFQGREVVTHLEKPVWEMKYKGKVTRPDLDSRITEVLRKALRCFPKKIPIRGCSRYPDQDALDGFVYMFDVEGLSDGPVIALFKGKEVIAYNGEEVYSLECSGGFIQ
ncbi:hypothetical protein KY328_04005 [Candidatus Woesearchaeota archaeon]|nr:hypothetical protein [Candidatus Woesearchaeota archaeon]MBW3022061.1 hypothetical protein [Candidatus Woesearchaeota archaeon]